MSCLVFFCFFSVYVFFFLHLGLICLNLWRLKTGGKDNTTFGVFNRPLLENITIASTNSADYVALSPLARQIPKDYRTWTGDDPYDRIGHTVCSKVVFLNLKARDSRSMSVPCLSVCGVTEHKGRDTRRCALLTQRSRFYSFVLTTFTLGSTSSKTLNRTLFIQVTSKSSGLFNWFGRPSISSFGSLCAEKERSCSRDLPRGRGTSTCTVDGVISSSSG